MDFLYLMQPIAIFAFLGVAYLVTISGRSSKRKVGPYSVPDWNFAIKKLWAKFAIRRWKKGRKNIQPNLESELPVNLTDESSWDCKSFSLFNPDGSSLFVSIKKRKTRISDVTVVLTLSDGTIYQLPGHPDTVFLNTSVNNWTGGGLKFTVLNPFRKLRISFNGPLSKGIENEIKENRTTIHVRFNFVWSNVQKPVFNVQDWSDELSAHSISMEAWRHPHWIDMLDQWDIGGYHQFGSAMGEVYIGSELEPQTLHLRGVRVRQWSQLGSTPIRRSLSVQGIGRDGTAYILHAESYCQGLSQNTYGSVRAACGDQDAIDESDLLLKDFAMYKTCIPNSYTIIITAGKRTFRLYFNLEKHKSVHLKNGRPWEWENIIIPFEGGVNESIGRGFIQLGYSFFEHSQSSPLDNIVCTKELKWGALSPNYSSKLCIDFSEEGATCPQLVGAKGASLALLHSAPSRNYTVPPGFCITVNALNIQINAINELKSSIENIINAGKTYDENNMKNACERTVNILKTSIIDFTIQSTINNYMDKLRKNIDHEMNPSKITFAVRSSGIGEDSEELSAAGQNATILGCRTADDIVQAVQECWSSLFTFQSIEYRRQHGQVANCGMGVVIQAMVDAHCAGVMFTRHPNTGNPSRILITSNFGLGESVVSGEVEPDTILLSRSYDNTVGIHKIEIGKKTHKVVVKTENQRKGTENVQLDDNVIREASLSEDECLKLGRIAIEQEAYWGAPRDIEWAMVDNKVYLLQARPITSLDMWTEYELTHEFDTPIMSEEDLMCFANTGEVLPGAVSALSQSTIVKRLDEGISTAVHPGWENSFHPESFIVTHHHIGINLYNLLYRDSTKEIDTGLKVMEMGIFGHHLLDDRLNAISLKRRSPSGSLAKAWKIFRMFGCLWNGQGNVDLATYLSKNFQIRFDKHDSAECMLKAIENSLHVYSEVLFLHGLITSASIFSEIFAMSILMEGKKDFTLDHYTDIARILSSCKDVVSADVPNSLNDIMTSICSSGKAKEFSEVSVDKAWEWLSENCKEAELKLRLFLQKHGHRSIKEFDLATETWEMNSKDLLKTLQAGVNAVRNIGPAAGKSHPLTVKELVAVLVSPKSNISKKLLKFLIPICQKAVVNRETSKEALILLIHKIRLAYLDLAEKMVEDWHLPDKRLIFYLTNYELEDLIKTRNAGHVAKAQQRRRLMPKWDKLQFKEVNEGCPQPLNANSGKIELREGSTENRLIGTPVCPGNITGRACVVHDLSEIGQLQNGDILITHSTDIGWSPYFPLLGGVVTELGGLISHGAVVAREYGLPCIVGAQGATSFFETGDTVLLAGMVGFIEKIDSDSQKEE